MIQVGMSRFRFLWRQQRFELLPLFIGQFMSSFAHEGAF